MAKFHRVLDSMVGVHLNAHVMGAYFSWLLYPSCKHFQQADMNFSCRIVCSLVYDQCSWLMILQTKSETKSSFSVSSDVPELVSPVSNYLAGFSRGACAYHLYWLCKLPDVLQTLREPWQECN